MITLGEYKDALKVIKDYNEQLRMQIYKENKKKHGLDPDRRIEMLWQLSERTLNCLRAYLTNRIPGKDSYTIRDLNQLSASGFRKFRGVGIYTYSELTDFMDKENIVYQL